MKIIKIENRDLNLINNLLEVWESAVRATHLFLSDKEIENIKEYVPEAIKFVPNLLVAENEEGKPLGFIGIQEQSLEMLFISNENRGHGIVKKLIEYGIENYSINEVSVNEQNPQAKGFYEHMGFEVYKRTELDKQGNPYPLLYMKIK